MVENIILDSCAFLSLLPAGARTIADVGSGAGIPGVPIAIVRPDMEMSLIESRRRRVSFLATVVRELALTHVQVVGARVEDLTETRRGAFDAVVMRCAGTVSAMLPSALAIVRRGGVVVATAKRGSSGDGGEAVTIAMPHGRSREFLRFHIG
jgi:16S rRNA (guanine527-N7)-methyltransferase